MTNSTLSGNSSNYSGGGIAAGFGATVTVTNSTLSNNSADYGGGIYNSGGTVTLANTIVASNSAGTYGPDAYGTFTSKGYNLIGNTARSSGLVSSDLQNQDALLGPLQDNGGPTKTHALLPGSPALNYIPQGTNGCGTTITTDHRGVKRPQGGRCEIGSFEDESPKVKRVAPRKDATGVAPGTTVRAYFSEEMRKRTINGTTFLLLNADESIVIGARVEYDAAADKAILTPTSPLERGTRYKAVVTTGAKDLAGNMLDQSQTKAGNQQKVWFFTVRN